MQGFLLVLALLVTLAAQIYINSSYNKTFVEQEFKKFMES